MNINDPSAGHGARLVVSLAQSMPLAQGRTWTADDYATRDAALARLGLGFVLRQRNRGGR